MPKEITLSYKEYEELKKEVEILEKKNEKLRNTNPKIILDKVNNTIEIGLFNGINTITQRAVTLGLEEAKIKAKYECPSEFQHRKPKDVVDKIYDLLNQIKNEKDIDLMSSIQNCNSKLNYLSSELLRYISNIEKDNENLPKKYHKNTRFLKTLNGDISDIAENLHKLYK